MQFKCSKLALGPLAAFLFALNIAAHAADQTTSYTGQAVEDAKSVLGAPARWRQQEWENFAWGSLAVIGTAAWLDNPLREATRKHPYDSELLLQIEKLGAEYSIVVIGGFYLAGSSDDNSTATRVAQDSLTASIIASGIITPALKIVTGRTRPFEDEDNSTFNGLSANKLNSSFPSGHTTEAFALASVIATHYEDSWIQYTSYSLATIVGLARIYHDAHFASDVVAGALIGNWVGSSVAARRQNRQSAQYMLLPEAAENFAGLRLIGIY